MSLDYDLVVRGGAIVDGSGRAEFKADVAISGDRIVAVGEVQGRGSEEIDATGQIVTPGFIDIHTHYDGQVIWEERTAPSSDHGVTTVLMGNCGVGFAPCRPEDRMALVHLMEGVEDVPEAVMTEGLEWNWETFPQYLEAVEGRARDIDVAAQLPHSCLRVYVMGKRGLAGEDANEADLQQMREITREAMAAGALGLGTSRSLFHSSSEGTPIPSKNAREAELQAIAQGMADAGHGVIEALFDFENLEVEFDLLRRVARKSGRPVSFSLFQTKSSPTQWKRALELIAEANAEGLLMKAQVIGRPTGILLGLNLSYSPLSFYPSYIAIQSLPLEDRVRALRDPEIRRRILSEKPLEAAYVGLNKFLYAYEYMCKLGEPVNYEPDLASSVAAQAARRGISPLEIVYDMLLEGEGHAVLLVMVANYADGNLDAVLEMLRNDHTLLGLGDGGAHYGMICDAGYPTFMLSYWARDREGEKLPLTKVVKSLTYDNAVAIGLKDRGLVAPGYKADLNVIDMKHLALRSPRVAFDLPAGGRRVTQAADGYTATIVSGQVMQRNGTPTGNLPGRLVRGPQMARADNPVRTA